jgi:F-type H+-transporting ATPase subunit c
MESLLPISAALAVLPCVAAGFGMTLATSKAVESIARQPEASGKIQSVLLLGLVLAESTAIYGFVISLLMVFKIV